jgi:hypothetical protein
MSPLWTESDIRDARVDSQKACAEEDVLRQKRMFSRRIPLFSGTRLILFSKSVRRKMPRSQVSAFMFSRSYTYNVHLHGGDITLRSWTGHDRSLWVHCSGGVTRGRNDDWTLNP